MAQWIKVLATKLKDLGSILRTHLVEGESCLPQVVGSGTCTFTNKQMNITTNKPL